VGSRVDAECPRNPLRRTQPRVQNPSVTVLSTGSWSDERAYAERLRLAVEVSDIGAWEVDPINDETHWDRRTREILGVPLEGEVDQQMFFDCLHPEDRERVGRDVAQAYDPAIGVYDTTYRVGSETSFRWVRARGRSFFGDDGNPERFVGIVLDVTEEVRQQEQLEALREQAERANRAKDQFMAMLGHELRNPLAPILLGVELLRQRGDDSREVATIERQARQLERLVDDLLDVARITNGKVVLKKAPCAVGEIVESAVEAVTHELELRQQRLVLHGDGSTVLHGVDRARLAQVLGNLLHNASKFSPDGATVEVSHGRDGERYVIAVIDTGKGFDQDIVDKVFLPFEQLPQSLDRGHGGLGLGLAIVKALVEQHEGTIDVSAGPAGKGARFEVSLPFRASEGSTATGEDEPARQPGAVRCLIVDDNVDLCALLADALSMKGHVVETAFDGAEALAKASSFRPQVAFVDIGLPIVDGYAVAETFREQLEAPPVLIAMSGYVQPPDRERSRESGFVEHLDKPVSVERLLGSIAEHAQRVGE